MSAVSIDLGKDVSKMSGAIQIAVMKRITVHSDHVVKANDLWIEDVAIHCKAV